MLQRFNLKLKKRKKAGVPVNEKTIKELLNEELQSYIKREDLQGMLDSIERDKRKKEIWESLSSHKKMQLLRYALTRKGVKDGKK